MAFTEDQRKALAAKLSCRHVKTRLADGATIPYVEGWRVIAEANRIFGHDSWDRTTLSPKCLWSEMQRGQRVCFYTTKVRITVRAGPLTITRDGIGTGLGRSPAPELAHEMALKAAETDATKRALATFGNPFGLALYDKDMAQVTRSAKKAGPPAGTARNGPTTDPQHAALVLVRGDGRQDRFEQPQAFVAAALKAIPDLPTVDSLYAFWDANGASLAALKERAGNSDADPTAAVIAALKQRARVLGRADTSSETAPALAFPKEARLRSKAHLAFVARQPCAVCGRQPAHAHHLRFAQPRAMGLKVSDEFTVPLCALHHDALHRTGDERAWWARHGIPDPLQIAAKLWAASRLGEEAAREPSPTAPPDAPPAGEPSPTA
jgi:DNA recombination protein Rad52